MSGLRVNVVPNAPTSVAVGPFVPDFFISPTGSDSNPGTAIQPWAITAINTKQGTYAAKKVGLQDGTYDISTLPQTARTVKLWVASGTITNPTVIKSVNPRQAILSINTAAVGYIAGPHIGDGANGVNATGTPQYITIEDIVVTGGESSGVSYAGTTVNTCVGLIMRGLHVHDIVNPNNGANIGGIICATGPTGALVDNCLIHDIYTNVSLPNPRNQHGNSSGIHSYDNNMVVQYTTIHSCNNAVYQKNQGATPPPGGMEIKYCYFYYGAGMGPWIAGFNNANGVTPPYATQNFHHNIVENCAPYEQDNSAPNFLQAPTNIYNNLFIWSSTLNPTGIGGMPGPTTGAPWNFLSVYNNILVRVTAGPNGSRGDISYGPSLGDWTVVDFNRWPSDTKFGVSSATNVAPGSLFTLASWKTQTGTPDTHSITTDPLLVYELTSLVLGGGTAQYQLQGGSPCINAGRVGGVVGGAAIDMGPWQGGIQPGCNFT